MFLKSTLSGIWSNIQQQLFPMVENYAGKLSSDYKKLIAILEIVKIEEQLPSTRFNLGRPTKDRLCIARAFIAKAFLKINYTKQLVSFLKSNNQLKLICGWEITSEIPSESKFSRAFKEFSESSILGRVHQSLISQIYENKHLLHLTIDSTPICSRERALKKEGTYKERKTKANKRYLAEKKGKLKSRRQKQLNQFTLDEMVEDLPKSCDVGSKKCPQGYIKAWKGYKLHVAISDECIPVTALLTSASLNDCEVAIPLLKKSNNVVKNYYDLMDSAYDVPEIKEHSYQLGHIPIIDTNSRGAVKKAEKLAEKKRKKLLNFQTAKDGRYKNRFSKERFNALFKDFFGGRNIFYKGHKKVFCHLSFGMLALTASTLFSYF